MSEDTQAPQSAMEALAASTAAPEAAPSTTPMADAVAPSVQDINLQGLKERMDQYIAAMAPGKPVSTADIAQYQTQLWRAFQFVISKEQGEFVALWSLLLQYFFDNRDPRTGALSRAYAFRGMDSVRLTIPERRNLERLLHLCITTCDPTTRRFTLKQLDLRNVLGGFPDNNIVQRITAFYTV